MSERIESDAIPEGLRAALDRWHPGQPREEFRAQLAAEFIGGGALALSETDRLAVEDQLARWRPPAAREAFRAALRQAFVRGRQLAGAPLRAPTRRLGRSAIAVFAAAAALLLWLGAGFIAPKGWRLVDSPVTSELLLDGATVAFADSNRLEETFVHGGCLVQTTDAPLRMVSLGEGIVLELLPETEFEVLERRPGDELLTLRLHHGGVRVATCPKHGDCVRVITEDTEVRLAGRSLGVTVNAEGTCLCVLEGQGTLALAGNGEPIRVASNTTAWISRETREVVFDRETLHHEESLAQFATVSDRYFY